MPAGYFAWSCFDESALVEVVAGPKICLYWIRDSFMWPAACFAGPEVFCVGNDDMSSLVIAGGRVVDPASGMDAIGDVAVEDGRISAVGTGLGSAERVI